MNYELEMQQEAPSPCGLFEDLWTCARSNWWGAAGSKAEARKQFEKMELTQQDVMNMVRWITTAKKILLDNNMLDPKMFQANWKHTCRWLKYRCWEDDLPQKLPEPVSNVLLFPEDDDD